MSESDDKASGDVSVEEKPISEHGNAVPEPEPPKPPDVELIVDGFGLMPKHHGSKQSYHSKSSDEVSNESPCASSSNIDIVRRYTWRTKNRMTVQVITYGATITSIQVPDKKGVSADVLAGFDSLEEYFQAKNPYFGATIGRYSNYVREGTMQVRPSGRIYMLSTNKGNHHYNGGHIGFDKVNWRSYVNGNKVIMSHVSERFHEGYPGTVMTQITFEVTCENTIKIEMKCTTSEPTIVNLSGAPYFNLAGHQAGPDIMYDHIFTINADKYTPTDLDGLIIGDKKVVGGTPYDFRIPRLLKTMMSKIPMGGYDINYCVTQGTEQDLTFHARALHPISGRVLEVYSNQPGLQFYTGNRLPDPNLIVEAPNNQDEEECAHEGLEDSQSDESNGEEGSINESEGKKCCGYVPLVGKGGTHYIKHGLFCLMPQNFPDAINHNGDSHGSASGRLGSAFARSDLAEHELLAEREPLADRKVELVAEYLARTERLAPLFPRLQPRTRPLPLDLIEECRLAYETPQNLALELTKSILYKNVDSIDMKTLKSLNSQGEDSLWNSKPQQYFESMKYGSGIETDDREFEDDSLA